MSITIAQVRKLSINFYGIDAEFVKNIHDHTDYPVFFVDNDIYNTEEIIKRFGFDQMDPTEIFEQQELGLFREIKTYGKDEVTEVNYHIRSVGGEFFGSATPFKVILTNVFIAGAKLTEYKLLKSVQQAVNTFRGTPMLENLTKLLAIEESTKP